MIGAAIVVGLVVALVIGRRRVLRRRAHAQLGLLAEPERPVQTPGPSLGLLLDLADPSASQCSDPGCTTPGCTAWHGADA